jgi:hypothetical protein
VRDPARIPRILAKLERVWREDPDLRLGQIVVNAIKYHPTWQPEGTVGVFYREDNIVEAGLDALLARDDTHRPEDDAEAESPHQRFVQGVEEAEGEIRAGQAPVYENVDDLIDDLGLRLEPD